MKGMRHSFALAIVFALTSLGPCDFDGCQSHASEGSRGITDPSRAESWLPERLA